MKLTLSNNSVPILTQDYYITAGTDSIPINTFTTTATPINTCPPATPINTFTTATPGYYCVTDETVKAEKEEETVKTKKKEKKK